MAVGMRWTIIGDRLCAEHDRRFAATRSRPTVVIMPDQWFVVKASRVDRICAPSAVQLASCTSEHFKIWVDTLVLCDNNLNPSLSYAVTYADDNTGVAPDRQFPR